MKIAITATGGERNSEIDSRFGRAQGFVIYDMENDTIEFQDNGTGVNASHGAGTQSAKFIIDSGITVLLSGGKAGPKAFATLQAGEIEIFEITGGTVQEAIDAYKAGTLVKQGGAGAEGAHH